MLRLSEGRYENVIYIEIDGEIREEDAEKSEQFIQEHYGEDAKINALVYLKQIEGTDLGATIKGALLDARHWDQYGKFAVVADPAWIAGGTAVADLMPDIEVRQFDKAQIESAWEWLK